MNLQANPSPEKCWSIKAADGDIRGPMSVVAIRTLLEDGFLKSDSLVAHGSDLSVWMPLSSFEALWNTELDRTLKLSLLKVPTSDGSIEVGALEGGDKSSIELVEQDEMRAGEGGVEVEPKPIDVRDMIRQARLGDTFSLTSFKMPKLEANEDDPNDIASQLLAMRKTHELRGEERDRDALMGTVYLRARGILGQILAATAFSWVYTLFDPWMVFIIGIPVCYFGISGIRWLISKSTTSIPQEGSIRENVVALLFALVIPYSFIGQRIDENVGPALILEKIELFVGDVFHVAVNSESE